MDLVTTAISTVLAAISNNEADKTLIKTYKELLEVLKKKFGNNIELFQSIGFLESKPESSARIEVLQEIIDEINVNQDPEIRVLAQKIIKQNEDHLSPYIRDISSEFGRINRLAGDPTTDAPPPPRRRK